MFPLSRIDAEKWKFRPDFGEKLMLKTVHLVSGLKIEEYLGKVHSLPFTNTRSKNEVALELD